MELDPFGSICYAASLPVDVREYPPFSHTAALLRTEWCQEIFVYFCCFERPKAILTVREVVHEVHGASADSREQDERWMPRRLGGVEVCGGVVSSTPCT